MPPANCRLIDDTWFILKGGKKLEILRRKGRRDNWQERGYKAGNDGEMLRGNPNTSTRGEYDFRQHPSPSGEIDSRRIRKIFRYMIGRQKLTIPRSGKSGSGCSQQMTVLLERRYGKTNGETFWSRSRPKGVCNVAEELQSPSATEPPSQEHRYSKTGVQRSFEESDLRVYAKARRGSKDCGAYLHPFMERRMRLWVDGTVFSERLVTGDVKDTKTILNNVGNFRCEEEVTKRTNYDEARLISQPASCL
jgi:hypothetical protein